METPDTMSGLGGFPDEVATPAGWICEHCGEAIEDGDRGRVIELESGAGHRTVAYHQDCLDEAVSLGIGG